MNIQETHIPITWERRDEKLTNTAVRCKTFL